MTDVRRRQVWPSALAFAEGAENARSGRWASVVVALAVAGVLGAAALSNVLDVGRLVRAEAEWAAAGAFVLVAEPGRAEGGTIDAPRCDRLSALEGVDGAFAVSGVRGALGLAAEPGIRATQIIVSPGIFDFLDLAPVAGHGALATDEVLIPLGLGDGDEVVLVEDPSEYRGVTVGTRRVDSAVLGRDLDGAWIVADPTERDATQCYVRSDAGHVEAVAGYLPLALGSEASGPVVVRPRLQESAHGLGFAGSYATRELGTAWLGAAVVLGGMVALVRWTRRARLAVYVTYGVHRRALVVLQLSEWLVLSVPAAVWAWGVVTCVGIALGTDVAVVAAQGAGHMVAGWACATLLVLAISLIPVRSLVETLKDRS